MKWKNLFYSIVFLLLVFINVFILINRNNGFKYYPLKTYSEIYQEDSSFFIKNIFFNDDSVQFTFSKNLPSEIYILDQQKIHSTFNSITFPLHKRYYEYALFPVNGKGSVLIFHIDHAASATHIFTNEFLYSNIPGPDILTSPITLWEKGIRHYSENDIAQGRKLLQEKTSISNAETDSSKFMQIASLMAGIHSSPNGTSLQVMNTFSPYTQIIQSLNGNTQLDCGNFSLMLSFLCDIEGLPNRRVTYRGPDGNWRYGVHYMNEIYWREKQTWILADALNNIYCPHDSARFYNAVDVKKINQINGWDGKKVFTFQNDSMKVINYNETAYWHQYYNSSNASIAFLYNGEEVKNSTFQNLFQFYTFSHHEIWYNDNKQNNWLRILFKLGTFYALLFFIVGWGYVQIKKRIFSKN
ncbi:MAG: hypothetical protein JSS67_05550 [Bacteroidetes bacterium]|nr:hypothetical protein [Bacteroidota bacterium]